MAQTARTTSLWRYVNSFACVMKERYPDPEAIGKDVRRDEYDSDESWARAMAEAISVRNEVLLLLRHGKPCAVRFRPERAKLGLDEYETAPEGYVRVRIHLRAFADFRLLCTVRSETGKPTAVYMFHQITQALSPTVSEDLGVEVRVPKGVSTSGRMDAKIIKAAKSRGLGRLDAMALSGIAKELADHHVRDTRLFHDEPIEIEEADGSVLQGVRGEVKFRISALVGIGSRALARSSRGL